MGLEESVLKIAVLGDALLALHTFSVIFSIYKKSLLSQFLLVIVLIRLWSLLFDGQFVNLINISIRAQSLHGFRIGPIWLKLAYYGCSLVFSIIYAVMLNTKFTISVQYIRPSTTTSRGGWLVWSWAELFMLQGYSGWDIEDRHGIRDLSEISKGEGGKCEWSDENIMTLP